MSITPLLVESKNSRAIYLAASTIIMVAPVVVWAMAVGFSLSPSFENGLVQVPFAGVLVLLIPFISSLAVLLWGTRPEHFAVERWALGRMLNDTASSKYLLNMTAFILYIRPWESSSWLELPLRETLTTELRRTMRGVEFEEQVSEYRNVFWILLLTPLSFFDMSVYVPGVSFWVASGLLVLGMAVGMTLSLPFVLRNDKLLMRAIDYTFTRWVRETLSADMKRKTVGPFQPSTEAIQIHQSILDMATAVVELAVRRDWAGFDRNSKGIEGRIPILVSRRLSRILLEEYLRLVLWAIHEAEGERAISADMFLKNAHLQILDAIGIYKQAYSSKMLPEEVSLASTLENMLSRVMDLQTVLSLDAMFCESFDQEAIKLLGDSGYAVLGDIPFALKKRETPTLNVGFGGVDKTAWLLVTAAEEDLLDMVVILRRVAIWRVHPAVIAKAMRPKAAKTLLEVDVGYHIDQLESIVGVLRSFVDEHPNGFEPDRVYLWLKGMAAKYGVQPVIHFAGNVTSKRVPPSSGTPGNVYEAIAKFLDEGRRPV